MLLTGQACSEQLRTLAQEGLASPSWARVCCRRLVTQSRLGMALHG